VIERVQAILAHTPVDPHVARAARRAADVQANEKTAATRAAVSAKVLRAFREEAIAESDLAGTLGYGYGDAARDRYESLLARVLDAEACLARLSLVSGTHAIVTALATFLPPDSALLAVAGRPYDTLRHAIRTAPDSLVSRGVRYERVPLTSDGDVNDAAVVATASRVQPDVAFIQRSRGYAPRTTLSAQRCGDLAHAVRAASPKTIVIVDNCYGELVDAIEPTAAGADLIAGSLIKNLGGGIAPAGGYVAGRADLVERVASRHYAPGLGSAVGSSLGFGRLFVQGLYYAPLVVSEALAGLDFAAALFRELGFSVDPAPGAERHDIVQAIRLGDRSRLIAFARGLQAAMPINARFAPEPGPVPGYPDPVLMSGGAFVAGATIELSCDAPLREPFEVYLQGGITRDHAVFGALMAAGALAQEKLLF
jgi:cystathionine beta-lyase family protein involved in aluminum resistance